MKPVVLYALLMSLVAIVGCEKDTPAKQAEREVKQALSKQHLAQKMVNQLVFVKHKESGMCFAYTEDSYGGEMLVPVDCGVADLMMGKQK